MENGSNSMNTQYHDVMRKIPSITFAVILATIAGCQTDDQILNVPSKVDKIFHATFEQNIDTRTALDDSNNVLWSDGDQISVFAGTTANNSFLLQDGANTTYGVFAMNSAAAGTESNVSSSALSANVAYYPYDSNVTVSESNGSYTFQATFPAAQTYSASGTFGNGTSPMVAVTSNTLDANLKFKNVGAIFRLQLKGEATITKVTFSADASLAGYCSITASNVEGSTSAPTVSVIDGASTLMLDCGEGVQLNNSTVTDFIVAMLPMENVTGGMTISIYDNAGKKMVYTHKANEPITIERSKAYTTAEVTYSGDQDVLTAVGAQAALDNATSGTIIQLDPGVNYGTLLVRPILGAANTQSGDWFTGNYSTELARTIADVTLVGAPGATVDAIEFVAGYKGSNYMAGAPDLMCYANINNLVIDGVEFSDHATDPGLGYNAPIFVNLQNTNLDGLTVKNCRLIGTNPKTDLVYIYGSQGNHTFTTASKNVTITGNTVDGIARLCELRETDNVTITGNIIKNTAEHGMLLACNTGKTYSGNVTITGNMADGTGDRFVRMAGAGNAAVVIKNNTITNYLGADPDFIKVTDSTGTIETDNNTFTVSTTDNLQKLILNTMDGTVFQLGAGDYGNLDFTHTYNGSKVQAQRITVQGVSGTVMSDLVSPVGGNQIVNWAIKGIQFDGRGIDIRSGGNALTVEACNFTDGANIYLSNNHENITIANCGFNASVTGGVYLQQVKDVAITNCTFMNMPYNAIQLSGAGVSGAVSIAGNTISNCASRAMRIVTASGAALTISSNTMTESDNANDATVADRGQVIKITGAVLTGTFENNTHNGNPVTFTNGIATE